MTDNERALLLEIAKTVVNAPRTNPLGIRSLIAAVEAEAAPDPLQSGLDAFKKVLHSAAYDPEPLAEAPSKSCETCRREQWCCPFHVSGPMYDCDEWQPKPSVCPTCRGIAHRSNTRFVCEHCGGTGEEKK